MSNLANCPFCGSDPMVYPDGDMEGYAVMCSGNKDSLGACAATRFAYPTQDDADAAWNRRAQPAQSAIDAAARIEALELVVERNHGTINIISGALSATEKELAKWRSEAGTLENELRRARCDIEDAVLAEREACIATCALVAREAAQPDIYEGGYSNGVNLAEECMEAIRARTPIGNSEGAAGAETGAELPSGKDEK